MYYYPKLPFFIENVSLNVCINTLCPTACFMPTDFYPTECVYPSGISSSSHDIKLNFASVISRVNELHPVALSTRSRGRSINYRPESNF